MKIYNFSLGFEKAGNVSEFGGTIAANNRECALLLAVRKARNLGIKGKLFSQSVIRC